MNPTLQRLYTEALDAPCPKCAQGPYRKVVGRTLTKKTLKCPNCGYTNTVAV